jgi:hypothetical protein
MAVRTILSGMHQHTTSRLGGWPLALRGWRLRQLISSARSGADLPSDDYPGLKPRAESLRPFGTISQRFHFPPSALLHHLSLSYLTYHPS